MNAVDNNFPIAVGPVGAAAPASLFSWRDIVWSLRRGWLLPILGCLLGLAAAIAYILLVPELYKSTARILIDRSVNRYLQDNKIVDEPTYDNTETGSQIYVLSSDSIVVPVIQSMNLTHDPEFVGAPKGTPSAWSQNQAITIVKRILNMSTESAADTDTSLERKVVEAFAKRLTVYREDVDSVINVTFASENPKKAADIANAIADTYLSATLDAKFQSTKIAGQLIQKRLLELKQQVVDADRSVQDYKLANNLSETDSGQLPTQQIASLSTQLTNAKIALAEAKARLDHAQPGAAAGASGEKVPNNEIITQLRIQYLELAGKAAEIESRVGPNHVAVQKLRSRMVEMNAAISDEEKKITDAYAGDYRLAEAKKDELSSTMSQMLKDMESNSQAQIKLRELEVSSENLHTLYNGFLQKFNEINKIDPQSVPVLDARIITRASPALQRNSKKALLILGASLLLGLFFGAGAAVAKELAVDVFRTSEQVKRASDIYSLTLPNISKDVQNGAKDTSTKTPGVGSEFVIYGRNWRFAEALRNLRAIINFGQRINGDQVICVVSCLAQEGKTTIATNLAALISSSSTTRTLLIDADLYRRQLTANLAPTATAGLLESLVDPARLPSLVCKRFGNVDVLPCILTANVSEPAELLGSPQMERLIAAAREAYDCVIIEAPPMMSSVDVKMIERFVDKFVVVVEWGKTKRRVLAETLSEMEIIRDRILCIVLNKADPAALRSIEAYKMDRVRDR